MSIRQYSPKAHHRAPAPDMFQAPPQSDALENRPLGMTGRSTSENLFLDSVLWFSCVPMFCLSLSFCFIYIYMTCLFLLSFPLHFCSVVFSYLFLSFPFSSSQSSSEEAANHLIKLSTSLHLFPPFACPFGPDPCAPTTGQRSRCNRHSQPTHQTYGERCRWWIATEPCLRELCPTFGVVSGFVHSLSCYSPGSKSLLLE